MAGSIEVRGLTKSFGGFQAVHDVSFSAAEGTITALLGPSGSGKSTVLRMIAGLEQPDSGSVWVSGEELTDASVQDRRLGFVFQHYALFRHMTVRRNVAFGLSVRRVDKTAQRQRVDELLELVGLAPFAHRYPDQLSGGQRQRVALARALAPRPQVLLLDEPFGALDARVRQELRDWLDGLHRELGVTSLFVTHDQEEALELANEVVVMNHGKVEQVGAADQIYNQPATPFVAAFVGSSNVLRGTVWERYVHFGRSAVAGAHHIPDGREAVAYIRPHDVEVTAALGEMSFPIAVERRTDMGWTAKLYLRLEDGQPLVAQLPNEEIEGVTPGQRLYANLRNPKVFADDRVATPSDANAEPAPHANETDEDADDPAERSELTSARPA
jgi:sulfate transport system ATP-binding protein